MKILLLLLLMVTPAKPIPVNEKPGYTDSTFFVKLDKDHKAVLRRYIQENKRHGLQKDTTVLVVAIKDPYNNPDYHEIQIGASSSRNILSENTPAYLSEVDGYNVAVYFSWYSTCPGIVYPKSYLEKVNQLAAKLRREKVSPYPIEHCENWKVIFWKGKEPEIKKLL